MHGFRALVEIARLLDLSEHAQLFGLERKVHGAIRIRPVAQHAQANEIGLLALDLLGGVGAAQFAELRRRNVLAVGLFHLQFDRQAVAVPARHVRRVEAGQGLGLDDDVLEDLVHRVADVNVAVGVGRAVVQDEFRPPGRRVADRLVAFFFLPAFHPAGLAFGEVAAHRERGIGQVERALVIGLGVVRHDVASGIVWRCRRRGGFARRGCRDRGISPRRAACAGSPRARGDRTGRL